MPDEVTTTRTAWKVVGFANRSALSQKILKFCGIFPIYEIEIEESGIPLEIFNIPQRQASGKKEYAISVTLRNNYLNCAKHSNSGVGEKEGAE